jgi:hypothetical protein
LDNNALLESLGATDRMISQYELVYSTRHGLIATADWELCQHFDVFPSQVVRQAATDGSDPVEVEVEAPWRIHLGSQVTLHPDDDDGSRFLVDLLDEIREYLESEKSDAEPRTWGTFVEETSETIDTEVWDESTRAWTTVKEVKVEWVTRRLVEGEIIDKVHGEALDSANATPAESDDGIDDAEGEGGEEQAEREEEEEAEEEEEEAVATDEEGGEEGGCAALSPSHPAQTDDGVQGEGGQVPAAAVDDPSLAGTRTLEQFWGRKSD